MDKLRPRYSDHYDTLLALISYLGIHTEDYGGAKGKRDSANAIELAERLSIPEAEVKFVLDSFSGIFRRSQKEQPTPDYGRGYRYSLHLRYARRKYLGGAIKEFGEPLSNDDLFSLLEFVTNRVKEELESQRSLRSNRITMIGVWVAGTMSLLSVLANLLK
jgi:hypothetical protein